MRRISRKDAKAQRGVWDDFRVLEVVMRRISRKGAKTLSGVWDNCGVFGGCDDSFITQRRKGAKGVFGIIAEYLVVVMIVLSRKGAKWCLG